MQRLTSLRLPAALAPQHGLTLIESLVALVVAALGILGVLGVQMRTLADTQTGAQRAQAVRLIEDLGERIAANPNAAANAASYVINWGTANDNSLAPLSPLTPRAATLCTVAACTAAEQAAYDVREWKRAVELALGPGVADAAVFLAADETVPTNRRQLGVMVSWRANEADAAAASVFDITNTDTGVTGCPANRICHLQYVQLATRCKVDDRAGPANPLLFCAQ